jgi:hypothetical protein
MISPRLKYCCRQFHSHVQFIITPAVYNIPSIHHLIASIPLPTLAVRFVTDPTVAPDDIIAEIVFDSKERRDALLALRGFLANRVVWHCLSQRWLVDYGVIPANHPLPPGKKNRKRTAVPFRSADTPAERAEFAHADSTLAFVEPTRGLLLKRRHWVDVRTTLEGTPPPFESPLVNVVVIAQLLCRLAPTARITKVFLLQTKHISLFLS